EKDGAVTVFNPLRYPLDQLLMMYALAIEGGAIIHAAGINIEGKGYIFPGRSGAGKSTLSRQFRDREDAEVLSDDRMATRIVNGTIMTYGTPWPGEEGIALNKGVPLAGIFFMSHGDRNVIAEISPQNAVEKLMPVVSVPWYDPEMTSKILAFCDELVSNIPAFELQFKPVVEAADFFVESVSLNKAHSVSRRQN
ncbi:MAG TPA: hypothetical protein VMB78_08290, partial [Dissulfurispiraceae bacterium]|nr:hypothetical protein [Dissulfurispiraceae bacterium]